jgi:hypothetical protein
LLMTVIAVGEYEREEGKEKQVELEGLHLCSGSWEHAVCGQGHKYQANSIRPRSEMKILEAYPSYFYLFYSAYGPSSALVCLYISSRIPPFAVELLLV